MSRFFPPKLQIILREIKGHLCAMALRARPLKWYVERSAIQTPPLLWFQIHVQVYWEEI